MVKLFQFHHFLVELVTLRNVTITLLGYITTK